MTQAAEQVRERIRHKILVVEDESDIRELLRYNLEQDGFAVEEASDGAEALEAPTTMSSSLSVRAKSWLASRRYCAGRIRRLTQFHPGATSADASG